MVLVLQVRHGGPASVPHCAQSPVTGCPTYPQPNTTPEVALQQRQSDRADHWSGPRLLSGPCSWAAGLPLEGVYTVHLHDHHPARSSGYGASGLRGQVSPSSLAHPPAESDSPGGLPAGLWRRKQEELKTLKCSVPVIVAPSVHNQEGKYTSKEIA